MDSSWTWIVASLVVLAAVGLLVFRVGGASGRNRLTPLAGLALGLVIAGLVFGEERWLGYGLFAVGVILAVVDMVQRSRGT
jgi:membrane-bound ClpP family serine protease